MTFEDTLAQWLPAQRWFAGRAEPVRGLTVIADTQLAAGDPELRHLIVSLPGRQDAARYQVLVGLRDWLPASLSHAAIGPVPGGRTAYDALHDPELSGVLVEGIAAERTAGPLQFGREPGAPVGSWAGGRVLNAEQSNTSVVFGESAILKVLRRIFPGENPDLEVAGALTRLGSKRIAPPFGRIQTELSGEPVLLAVLSRYLAHATDGWTLAAANLRRLYARHGAYEQEYLTAPLPATADRPAPADRPAELAALADGMTRKLEQARAEFPELGRHAAKLRATYEDVARITEPVPLQRVHGDYHLGQVLLA